MIQNDIVSRETRSARPEHPAPEQAGDRLARSLARIAGFADVVVTTEAVISRLGEAGPGIRTTMARAVAHADRAPDALVEAFIAAGGPSAAYVLRHARMLSRRRLAEIAREAAPELACAIARRADLDEAIALVLAGRPESEIALALVCNRGAHLASEVCQVLARRAMGEPALAAALAARPVDARSGAAFFLYATPDVRAEIMRRARVLDVLGPRRDLACVADDDLSERVERLALAGARGALVAELSEAVGCTTRDVETLLRDERGEAAALLFAAAGITAPAAGRVFMSDLFGAPPPASAVHGLVSIVAHVSQRAARRLVASMCGGLTDPKGGRRHLPVYQAGSAVRAGSAERRRVLPQPAARTRIGRSA